MALTLMGSPPLTSGPCVLQILGVSVDSQFSHLAWCQTGGVSVKFRFWLLVRL